ncbi:unnamed protein product [Meganyctiphanes norvegica]|uniref:EF-hand domain-containing protein n=1 Tax=Meganyctiphanes norvegica TaxID=48144 RepID=A0AAV2S3G0_MEGNR
MGKGDVSSAEKEKIKFAFEIFDFTGHGKVDTYYIGDLLRALNLNPSNAVIEKYEPAPRKGTGALMSMAEFMPMYAEVKKDKENAGSYDDFIEVLKLYDKNEDGTMLLCELEYILKTLGEALPKSEVEGILDLCCPEEDEDGMVQYLPFLKKLCANVD